MLGSVDSRCCSAHNTRLTHPPRTPIPHPTLIPPSLTPQDLEEAQSGVCPQCPICKKSLGDYSRYWRAIDAQVAAARVPSEYRGWRADILCNDCS